MEEFERQGRGLVRENSTAYFGRNVSRFVKKLFVFFFFFIFGLPAMKIKITYNECFDRKTE